MALITLAQAKAHLRIEPDETSHDEMLEVYIDASSQLVLDYLKLPYGSYEDTAGDPLDVPGAVTAATLIMTAIFFREREAGSEDAMNLGELPRAVTRVLWMYRYPSIA